MGSKAEFEHYVPQFYLRNFARQKGRDYLISCFDKANKNTFTVNIRKIGAERKFYDISTDVEQEFEKELSKLEGELNLAYRKLIDSQDLEVLNKKEKMSIASFLALQFIRTKENRETIKDIIKQIKKKFFGEKLSKRLIDEINEASKEESIKRLHLSLMGEYQREAEILINMKWILFVNKTKMPYWTSDNPFVLYNSIDMKPYGNLGLTSRGIQTYLPLSPILSLGVCDPKRFVKLPNKWDVDNVENIIFQNHLQVKWSTRHVFSRNSDFDLAKRMLKEHPELGQPDRDRVKVS